MASFPIVLSEITTIGATMTALCATITAVHTTYPIVKETYGLTRRYYFNLINYFKHKLHPHTIINTKQYDLTVEHPLKDLIFDQGPLGSCTANATAYAYYNVHSDFIPSRLFAYYNTRWIEQDIPDDCGGSVLDAIQSICKYGFCSEDSYPYDITKFSDKPPAHCYDEAKYHEVLTFQVVNQTIDDIKAALLSNHVIIVGMTIYNEFYYVKKSGIIPMPSKYSVSQGGHCVAIVGYDDTKQLVTIKNSWGRKWGDNGNCYVPYEYILDETKTSELYIITNAM